MIERIRHFLRVGQREDVKEDVARQAEAWTTDDAFNIALARAKDQVITTWTLCTTPEDRERCFLQLKAFDLVDAELRRMANDRQMRRKSSAPSGGR